MSTLTVKPRTLKQGLLSLKIRPAGTTAGIGFSRNKIIPVFYKKAKLETKYVNADY